MAGSQIGVGAAGITVGVLLIVSPDPTMLTKVVGVVVIVASVAIAVADYVLERSQAKRIAARSRVIQKIDAETRHAVVLSELRSMI